MRIKRSLVMLGVAGLAVAAAQLFIFRSQPQAVTTQAPPTPEVGVVTLKAQPVAISAELAGRTTPFLIAEVRPQVSGIVKKRLFVEGADVKAGAALYQIDPATYQAAFESAKAALVKAEANLFSARLKADRYQDLVGIKAVSQQDFDDAVATLKQSEAEVALRRAALDSARINLDYTLVTAPIAGRIGRSAVTPGALVTANQAASLATVQQLDPIYVDLTQSSADLLRLKRQLASGQLKGVTTATARLTLEDGSAYPLEGRVQFSEATVDQGTGTVTLRAVFPNPRQELLPGMYVRATLETGIDEQAILVPQRAVTRNQRAEPVALVVSPEGKVEQRVIEISRAVGNDWLVRAGLASGDRVVVEGSQKIRPGAMARTVELDRPAAPPANPGQQ
ncbi:MAG: efflux RND transporter periplasmic adaptor subunit [Thermodesulfobacteriota bacterium]